MRAALVVVLLVLAGCAGPVRAPSSAACELAPASASGRFSSLEGLFPELDVVEESYAPSAGCGPAAPVHLGCVTAPLVDVGDPRVLSELGITAAHRVSVRGVGGDEDESALELTGTVLETGDPTALLTRLASTCGSASLEDGRLRVAAGEFKAEDHAVVGLESMSSGWGREDVASLLSGTSETEEA